jgi:DNA-binding transcriptional MocR family regulator
MDLRIERGGDEAHPCAPVYRQIADQLRTGIARGALAPGTRLPTIRDLARRLGVNRDTVALAYEALAAEGLLEARVGRGTFVRAGAGPRDAGAPAPLALSPGAERLLAHERARPRYGAEQGAIPLHALVPDPALFPVDAFRRSVNRVFSEAGAASLLLYGGPQGHAGLREVMAERLRVAGTRVGVESIVLCQGASQGIALALRLFAESGDAVAVESPTYGNALAALVALGLRPAAVPMGADGADLDALDRVLARPEVKLFYTIPTFHNPLGTTTPLAHREELLRIAARHGKPVVEDAFEMDLRFEGRPVPPLAALDESGLVVQLTSFSKSLFPGLRCGAVVARGRLVEALLVLRHATDLGGALPLQAALADFVRTGAYDRHLAALRRELRVRRDAMLEALAAAMPPGTRWTRPEGGYQVWVELPEPLDSRDLFADALRAGVLFAPGSQFRPDGRASRGLRLSLAQADAERIREGVARLGRIAGDRLRAGPEVARGAWVHA